MNSYEKKISFLNRYFIYKKIATVNAEKISIEMIEEGVDEKRKSRKSTSSSSNNLSSQSSTSSSKKTKSSKVTEKTKASRVTEKTKAISKTLATNTTEIKSKKNVTSKITSSKPTIRKLNDKLLILEDTGDTIQSEPVTKLDLNKSIVEKEITVRPNTNSGKKEKKQTLLIDETSVIDKKTLPIVTLTKEEPEMMTNVNTETRAITETKVIPEQDVVVYESKKHRNKYYIMDKETNKPQWIQLLENKKYPSGYYYTDGEQNVGIDKVVVNKD